MARRKLLFDAKHGRDLLILGGLSLVAVIGIAWAASAARSGSPESFSPAEGEVLVIRISGVPPSNQMAERVIDEQIQAALVGFGYASSGTTAAQVPPSEVGPREYVKKASIVGVPESSAMRARGIPADLLPGFRIIRIEPGGFLG